jgi:hypothetical protein
MRSQHLHVLCGSVQRGACIASGHEADPAMLLVQCCGSVCCVLPDSRADLIFEGVEALGEEGALAVLHYLHLAGDALAVCWSQYVLAVALQHHNAPTVGAFGPVHLVPAVRMAPSVSAADRHATDRWPAVRDADSDLPWLFVQQNLCVEVL